MPSYWRKRDLVIFGHLTRPQRSPVDLGPEVYIYTNRCEIFNCEVSRIHIEMMLFHPCSPLCPFHRLIDQVLLMEECPARRPMEEALMAATSSRTRLHALSTAVTTASRWTGRRWLSWPVTWRTNVTPSTWNTGLSNQRGGAWRHTLDS